MPNKGLLDLRSRLGRRLAKGVLAPLLRWPRPSKLEPDAGYSVVIGAPWDLRHLLPVNLRFVHRTDRRELHRIHVVFDRRPKEGAQSFIEHVRSEFPDMPLSFRFYPPISGWVTERIGVSTFFNSMNTILALGECTTRYAILHDFDLYPLRVDYFQQIYEKLRNERLHFAGAERTYFGGLTDQDNILGTWGLGIDASWLRERYSPISCFHRTIRMDTRTVEVDPYSAIQFQTDRRAPVDWSGELPFCHVQNLCSTYLRFSRGQRAKVAWRLHYLWYLESLASKDKSLEEVIRAMEASRDQWLTVRNYAADFSTVDPSCADVLRKELSVMDRSLFGKVRPVVERYLDSFERFLTAQQAREPATRLSNTGSVAPAVIPHSHGDGT